MSPDTSVLIPCAALAFALLAQFLPARWRTPGAIVGAALAAIATATAFLRSEPPVPEAEVATRPIAEDHDGYVGSAACRACHPHEHDTWHDSYHCTMTQVATPRSVLGDFGGLDVRIKDKYYRLGRTGDEFWVELDDPYAPAGGDPPRIRRRITLVTGSHNMQAYWFESGYGRVLAQLPLSWQVAEKRWITRDASFVLPPGEEHSLQYGSWNLICIKCHATQGRPRLDIEDGQMRDADTRVVEFGISCENCHGPGGAHVAANQNPVRRYVSRFADEPDPTIVNPARLDPRRATQVCGQCHAVWDYHLKSARMHAWFENGFTYRPGDDIEKNRDPVFKGASQFWSDGLIRTAGREYNALHGSKCFDGGMSCLSCHVMHPEDSAERTREEWANDQLHLGDLDRSCKECHADIAAAGAAHTHHVQGSEGSRCVNCHMPHTTYGLMKGVRTHRIASPSVKVSQRTGRPNACNQCHLDKTLAWTAEALHEWYGTEMPRLNRVERTLAASVRWALEGDACQRALMAWSLGWQPAQATAGTDWLVPILAELLVDPYPAVRYIAERSLRTLPGYEEFWNQLDGAPEVRQAARTAALEAWQASGVSTSFGKGRPALLLKADGMVDREAFAKVVARRDDSEVRLIE